MRTSNPADDNMKSERFIFQEIVKYFQLHTNRTIYIISWFIICS
jgi:hypothetical protein